MKLAVIATLTVLPAFGQFQGFRTTADGGQLLFDTTLARKGTEEPSQGRIYRLTGSGLECVAGVERVAPEVPNPILYPLPPNSFFTNYYNLDLPDVSADGKVTAFVSRRDCLGRCVQTVTNALASAKTVVVADGVRKEYYGVGRLSRNGRYLLTAPLQLNELLPVLSRLTDLETGEEAAFVPDVAEAVSVSASGNVLTDGGVAIGTSPRGLLAVGMGTAEKLRDSGGARFSDAVSDRSGSVILCLVRDEKHLFPALHVFRRGSGEDVELLRGAGEIGDLWLSADGATAFFRSTIQFGTANAPGASQVYRIGTDGGGFRRVTDDAEGVVRCAVSDDGGVVWYLTAAGRILRVIGDGAAVEVLGRTPGPRLAGPWVPGSAAEVTGGAGLGTIQLRVDGLAAPEVDLGALLPGRRFVRLPAELPVDAEIVAVFEGDSESVFAPVLRGTVKTSPLSPTLFALRPADGQFYDTPGEWFPYVVALHQDRATVITTAKPAAPGEMIHFLATGFGRTAAFECDHAVPSIVPAPELPGFSLVSATIPASQGPGNWSLTCRSGAAVFTGSVPVGSR